MASKLKTIGIWLAVFLPGFVCAIAYMVFIRLHLVLGLIPVVVFALFALFALKLTEKK
jgi:hypothetical protein